MAEKKRVFIDGQEIAGLVKMGEILVEMGTIEVPEFHRIRVIKNGMKKIPIVEFTYKIVRGTETQKFFRDWFYDDLDHDITIVRTDATGEEFARTLMPGCECIQYQEPEFDGANPTYAQLHVKIVPWDVLPIDSV